jgi:hypothetical protein
VPYGIICDHCGQSWRAQEAKTVKKMPTIAKLKDVHKARFGADMSTYFPCLSR